MHRGNSQLYSITLVGATNNPAQLWLGGSSGETQDASAALTARDVARSDLVFVGSKGCQDFTLLGLRHLEEVKGPPQLGGRELERPTRNVADPQRSHELEAGQPSQVLGVPFPQLRVSWALPLLPTWMALKGKGSR
jgi:hypothetical protein